MTIDKPEKFQNEIVDEINDILYGISEMSYLQRCFLNGIIRQTKPKKILELGVSAGGSSASILNSIKDFDNAKLYSIDYSKKWYVDSSKDTGFIIDEKFSYLKDKWKLYTGGTAARFMEEIGGGIDLCIIDTMHVNPGEFLDFLIVLPYLKKNAILIFHDIALHFFRKHSSTNGILFSCLKGKKISFNEGLLNKFSNIGAVILDENIMDNILDYLYLLTLPWEYLPTHNDILECQKLFSKNYKYEIADTFMNIMLHNRKLFIENRETFTGMEKDIIKENINLTKNNINKLDEKLNLLINCMAWWIPIKKWRNNFRNKFKI